jgi:hypothetical protein
MVIHFGFNKEAAGDNFFSKIRGKYETLQLNALAEFDNMVHQLHNHAINVMVIDDTKEPAKPDAISNNWLSTSSLMSFRL